MPYVGVVVKVTPGDGAVTAYKEYAGGVLAEFEVDLPAVIGIQAASQPPRYAPVSKIRQMSKTVTLDEIEAEVEEDGALTVRQMAKPVSAGHAEMLEGDEVEVAEKIIEIIKARGLLA